MNTEPLTPEKAQELFDALAALGDRIAFRWLREGCECRAQLMIEHLQAAGLEPGRAWAISVGKDLAVTNPANPKQVYKWANHVAPTVPVAGVEHERVVMDPSLSLTGPMTVSEWVSAMRVTAFEVTTGGLSQPEIQQRQADRAMHGEVLHAMVFLLQFGQRPIPEAGGTGFVIGPDPPEGASPYAHEMMRIYLDKQKRTRFPGR